MLNTQRYVGEVMAAGSAYKTLLVIESEERVGPLLSPPVPPRH